MLWTESDTSGRFQRLFRRRAKSTGGSTPLALAEGWSPASVRPPVEPRRGRPLRRKRTFACLFGCGVLPREATPEAESISPPLPTAPSAARQLHAALKDRALGARRTGLVVEQLCFDKDKGVARSSSTGSILDRQSAQREGRSSGGPALHLSGKLALRAPTSADLTPPSNEAILQELERCRMRLEDRVLRVEHAAERADSEAPAPEQLPSPAELRLRTPKRSTSRKGRPPRAMSQEKLQLAEVSAHAFHASWATISTPSTRASPGVHQASWSDVSSPSGESPGSRRRAATADARNFDRLEEAQALLSEMLSGGKSSSSRACQDGRRRHESAPPKAHVWPWASPGPRRRPPGAYSAPGGSFLTPLNGSMPWVPVIEIERPSLKTQARSSSEKRLAPLTPLVEHGVRRPEPIVAERLVIPEGPREPEADEEFCQILAAALAHETGVKTDKEPETFDKEAEAQADAFAGHKAEEVPGLSVPSTPSPTSGKLTPLPLPSSRGESPVEKVHPFGAEATPRSVSVETRAEAKRKSPKRLRRKDFAAVMAERRRLEEAQTVVRIDR